MSFQSVAMSTLKLVWRAPPVAPPARVAPPASTRDPVHVFSPFPLQAALARPLADASRPADMARSTRQARGKQLSAQTRRRLSEEGKRLLRHALAHEEDGSAVDAASVAASRDDESVDSELESVLRFEQEQQIVQQARASRAAAAGKRGARKGRGDDAAAAGVPDLDEAIEELTEKRDTTKIAALRKILSIMCSQVLTDSVDLFRSELTSQAVTCLKRRMKESSPLALRALAVLAITIGADAPDYYEDILTPVQRALTDEGEMAVRIEAAYALSISCFVCCPDEQHAWDVLEVLGGLLMAAREAEDENDDSFPEELVIAVMECWAFLVSAFPAELVASRMDSNSSILSDHMAAIAGFVRDGVNQTVRSAACEVLALLVQLKYVASGDGSDDEDGEGGWSYSDETDGSPIGGLEQKIAAYMRETGKQIGKKNRKQQRSTLKEVLETLRTGEGPHIELQVEDEKLSISTWDRFFQAHVFRRALQSGFQTHMLENSVLRDVFEVTDTAKVSMMSTMRRRADHKSKAIHKRNDVSRKGMAQNAFLYED